MISKKQMQEIDRYTIDVIGIPSIVLMENAKNAMMPHIPIAKKYIVICSRGNNGGDGLAIARDLFLKDQNVQIFVLGDHATKDFEINERILKNLGVIPHEIRNEKDVFDLERSLDRETVIIDAIFGTGLSKEVTGIYRQVIEKINESSSFIFSVDLPSGMDADTGKAHGIMVNAQKIVTLHQLKIGLKEVKNVTVVDIGIPKVVTEIILKRAD